MRLLTADPVARATGRLREAGVASPRVDAELLAAHVLGVGRSRLACSEWSEPALASYEELVARRVAREPVQYLTGAVGFRRLELAVGPGVFIPRPETESLVGWCLAQLRPGALVGDLCAGSGAIGLALADEAAGVSVHLVEREPAAFRWLVRNAAGADVHLHLGDFASALDELAGRLDLVVSNPPYLPTGARVEPEVSHFEPASALWAGEDGLAAVRAVIARAGVLLRPGGLVAIEHGEDQGLGACRCFPAADWTAVRDHLDLAGRPRFVTARRAA
ncbi:MAG: peptide chain release factor N(5)-glutamine methyltransferase [Mycobacteriales bacterium]